MVVVTWFECNYMEKMTVEVILFDFYFNYFTKNNVREAVLYCECVFYHVIYTCINQSASRIVTIRLIMCLIVLSPFSAVE